MDPFLFWTVVSGVATPLALIFFVLQYRRQHPKRKLSYAVTWSPLLTTPREGVHDEKLEVRYDGRRMDSPYVGLVEVYSDSRADIPSSAFDANSPIVIDMVHEIVSTSNRHPEDVQWEAVGSELRILPQLIRPKSGLLATVIVEGAPTKTRVRNPLIDIRVVEDRRLRPQVTGTVPVSVLTTFLIISSVVMALGAIAVFVVAASTGLL